MLLKTEDDRKKLIANVLKIDLEKGPYIVKAEKYKPARSDAQRRLQHMWCTAIGKHTGEGKEYITNYCKWTFGCPIVAQGDRAFNSFHTHMIDTYTYEQCVKAMEYIAVTSKGMMNVKQNAEYLDHINAYALERGCQLPQPEDLYDEAMGLTKEKPVEQADAAE